MFDSVSGGLAQLGERLPYKQDVGGSIPSSPIKVNISVFTFFFAFFSSSYVLYSFL